MGREKKQSLMTIITSSIWGTWTKVGLTLLFSSGLITSMSYLLFSTQSEENELEKQLAHFAMDSDITSSIQAGEIFNAGWFSNQDNLQRFHEIISVLTKSSPNSPLDDSFRDNSLEWCFAALQQSTLEKGKLEGFHLEDTIFLSVHQNMIRLYEDVIALTNELLYLVRNWSEISVDGQNASFDRILSLNLNLQEDMAQSMTLAQQQVSQIEIMEKEAVLERNNILDKNAVLLRRKLVAVGTIFLTVALLFISGSFYVVQIFLSRSKKATNPKKNRRSHK